MAITEPVWTKLGPLQISYDCLAWYFGGTPDSGRGGVSDSFNCSCDPFLPTELPSQALR